MIPCYTRLTVVDYQNLKKLKFIYPWGTSSETVSKIDDVLHGKLELLIVNVGINDLTNDINLLKNIKKIVTKTNKKSPNTVLSLQNIIICKDKKNLAK